MLNYAAVVLGAAFSMAFGFFWFGPLFGPTVARLEGKLGKPHPARTNVQVSLAMGFIAALLSCYVFAWMIEVARIAPFGGVASVGCASGTAVMAWMGFYLPFQLNRIAWERKNWRVTTINLGSELVRLSLLALMFWYWK